MFYQIMLLKNPGQLKKTFKNSWTHSMCVGFRFSSDQSLCALRCSCSIRNHAFLVDEETVASHLDCFGDLNLLQPMQ